ncbi:MAG: 1,4-dihydroxy-2-naphthoate polyprenyltransferase [Chloroflexi bacterium]|nr:1,4-dihydroxy-2-naphthoate polyprenyltransferase [Chloroflexota bacterium]
MTAFLRLWLLAARPRTLPAAIVPVLVGTALAARVRFQWPLFIATLAVSLLIQIGTNYANDVFDFLKGADQARRGPQRVTQSGLVSPRQMIAATASVFGAAALLGLTLASVAGWLLVVVGALAMAAGLAYTGGPWPLGYHGLGDLFVFVFFGVVAVSGSYYVQAGEVSAAALAASAPVGLLVTAILVVNNLRDIESDRAAGKRTLAVRIGARATRVQFDLLVGAAYTVPLLMWLAGMSGGLFWLPWLSLPWAARLVRDVYRAGDSPSLIRALGRTAQLHLGYGVLFALSLLLV